MDNPHIPKYFTPFSTMQVDSSPSRQLFADMEAARDPPTFPKFRKLPRRIRLQIWSYYLPGKRVLELCPCSWSRKTHTYNLSCRQGIIPLLLHVCHESRRYILSKGWQAAFQPNCWRGTPIYINFALDCVYLSPPKEIHDGGHAIGSFMFNFHVEINDAEDTIVLAKKCPKTDVERLQYLTVDLTQWHNTEEETRMLRCFKSLKEFVGVIEVGEKGCFDPVIGQALIDLKRSITTEQQKKKWAVPAVRVVPLEAARRNGHC